jgi:hypothetical protein
MNYKCNCQSLPTTVAIRKIIVDKVTDPAGATQLFNFTISSPATTTRSFSLADASTPYNTGALPSGIYSLDEINLPAGWTLDSVSCVDATARPSPTRSTST